LDERRAEISSLAPREGCSRNGGLPLQGLTRWRTTGSDCDDQRGKSLSGIGDLRPQMWCRSVRSIASERCFPPSLLASPTGATDLEEGSALRWSDDRRAREITDRPQIRVTLERPEPPPNRGGHATHDGLTALPKLQQRLDRSPVRSSSSERSSDREAITTAPMKRTTPANCHTRPALRYRRKARRVGSCSHATAPASP
jgi:hypothetical protein